jgi:hypothetical protein
MPALYELSTTVIRNLLVGQTKLFAIAELNKIIDGMEMILQDIVYIDKIVGVEKRLVYHPIR